MEKRKGIFGGFKCFNCKGDNPFFDINQHIINKINEQDNKYLIDTIIFEYGNKKKLKNFTKRKERLKQKVEINEVFKGDNIIDSKELKKFLKDKENLQHLMYLRNHINSEDNKEDKNNIFYDTTKMRIEYQKNILEKIQEKQDINLINTIIIKYSKKTREVRDGKWGKWRLKKKHLEKLKYKVSMDNFLEENDITEKELKNFIKKERNLKVLMEFSDLLYKQKEDTIEIDILIFDPEKMTVNFLESKDDLLLYDTDEYPHKKKKKRKWRKKIKKKKRSKKPGFSDSSSEEEFNIWI